MARQRYETVEVPFLTIGNRRGLTGLQLAEEPWLAEFVDRFKDSFEYLPNMDVAFFIEPGCINDHC
jgi:hypothetical protein